MKFQNCILINFVMGARADARTDKPNAICPFNFSKVGGIKSVCTLITCIFSVQSPIYIYITN